MPIHPKTIHYTGFKGLNNYLRPEDTNPLYLKKALNIDLDKSGRISKRSGYTKVDTATYSSLWASENGLGCYAIRNGDLVQINSDYSHTTLVSNIGTDKISFEEVDGIVYYSSISVNGIIFNGTIRSWGISKNLLSPTLSQTTGNLSSGIYQVLFTYVNSQGIESGSINSAVITVPDGSGISLYIPTPLDPDILYARIYCSTPNGTIDYYSGIGTLNSTYTISSVSSFSNPHRTLGLDKAPTGHIVKYYKGRVYVASDNILWYSEPLQYQHFNSASNYIEFPDYIREVMPVEDGIWIGSDRLYFLQGPSPDTFQRDIKDAVQLIEGTATKVSENYVKVDGLPPGYKWIVTTNLGIYVLANSSIAINLTVENVEIQRADSGTSLFLQSKGINQYLSILKTNDGPSNSVVGDLVETTIVRNGIIIS
jgi:hypothetical protein